MFFHSPLSLFVFIPFSIIAFLLLGQTRQIYRKAFLLLFSLFFYGFDHPWFLVPLLWSAIADYFFSNLLVVREYLNSTSKKILLFMSIASNMSLLFAFKYIPLISESLDLFGISSIIPPSLLRIAMPAGISFYTFQTMSYVFDAYRGKITSRVKFIDYLVYVCYFPQLVAGPILRPNEFFDGSGNMLISSKNSRIYSGFQRICFGLFLKLALADELARLNDIAYSVDALVSFTTLDSLTMATGFGLQIYFDFSAYSHMAIGISELIGLPIRENFNFPYLARSATEFWRRWHISLSRWVRDYLYSFLNFRLPMYCFGAIPILVTWILMGLWHGASWRFAAWGAINGLLVLIHRLYKSLRNKYSFIQFLSYPVPAFLITNLSIMCSWIYFRAGSWSHANSIFVGLFNPSLHLSLRENYYIFVFLFGVGATIAGLFWENRDDNNLIKNLVCHKVVVFAANTICLGLGLLFLNRQTPFIYFQF